MISLNEKFLFIHIPKTGGNSIQNILFQYSEDSRSISSEKRQDGVSRYGLKSSIHAELAKHSSLNDYKEKLESKTYQSLFKFTVIRNPWDRLISYYFSPHRGQQYWNRELFQKFIRTVKPLTYYISTYSDNNLSNKSIYSVKDKSYGDIHYVMRYEKLSNDFYDVMRLLKLEPKCLPHVNKSNRKNYKEYYDKQLINLVKDTFAEEIEIFQYEF